MLARPFSKVAAEFIGTFAIVFFGCGAVMVSERYNLAHLAGMVPLIFGMTVAVMIYALGHISGAHFNPAVTLAFTVAKHTSIANLFGYVIGQFLGASAAMLLLTAILPKGNSFAATVPTVAMGTALIWEMILTFFLMFVIISVATDTRAVGEIAGLSIGAVVALAAFVGGPITGASMNPARSFAPALVTGDFSHFWVYVLGPAVGALLAAKCYQFIRCDHDQVSSGVKGCCE